MGQRRSVRWGTAEKIRSSLPQGAHGQEHGLVLPTGSSSPVDDRPPTGVLHSNDPTLDRWRTGDRVNEKPLISNSSENYTSHFEAGTEFAIGVEPGDPLVSIVREKLFTLRLGQLSTWYVSRRRAQEN